MKLIPCCIAPYNLGQYWSNEEERSAAWAKASYAYNLADWFVWFYGISTTVGYLMLNPVFACLLNIWCVNTFCRYTPINDHTVLFQTIQFSINQQS